jgi:hypothetical protein
MTVMDITIHATFLPHDDPGASLAIYRDILGPAVQPRLSSPEVNRLGLVRHTEVLRNG